MPLCRTNVVLHSIGTGGSRPIQLSASRLPHLKEPAVKEMLDDMLGEGVVEHSQISRVCEI